MKQVRWTAKAITLVDTDDEDDALEQVKKMLDDRPWGGDTGKCVITIEQFEVAAPTEADAEIVVGE